MRIGSVTLLTKIALFGLLPAGIARAQTPATRADHDHAGHNHAGHDHSDHAGHSHSTETVAFTLPNWKTMHFEDSRKAAQHADAIKKLGCEIKQGQHAGHIDVSYRCVQWRTMELANHQLADQWIGWLKGSGFDTSHAHLDPNYTNGAEVVEFRLTNWKAVHGKGGDQDREMIDLLTKIGCEVSVAEHAGHSDITFRAPTWRDVHMTDHADAEKLMAWLKQAGFEVAPHRH